MRTSTPPTALEHERKWEKTPTKKTRLTRRVAAHTTPTILTQANPAAIVALLKTAIAHIAPALQHTTPGADLPRVDLLLASIPLPPGQIAWSPLTQHYENMSAKVVENALYVMLWGQLHMLYHQQAYAQRRANSHHDGYGQDTITDERYR